MALAMRHNVTATELRDMIYTHPSATEALNEVLRRILKRSRDRLTIMSRCIVITIDYLEPGDSVDGC